MSPLLFDLVLQSLWQTVAMVAASGAIAVIAGLPIAVLLVVTAREGILPYPAIHCFLGWIVNAFRSVPFIILLVLLIPLTRLIAGTSLGTAAAIVPLSIACIPYYARIAEVSLREVDRGVIDAVGAMGATRWTIVRKVILPEALPGLISGVTVTLVTLLGASAMAGAIGAGGLGDLAIRYGYQRFETNVMFVIVLILIVMTCSVQFAGDRLAKWLDHRT
ncbi:MAG TPA: methionine ABC transporter permease [Acetobacteraceae bacterium]|nr:methionine ABC transporter permease [Acetobacteraceae bacterium]